MSNHIVALLLCSSGMLHVFTSGLQLTFQRHILEYLPDGLQVLRNMLATSGISRMSVIISEFVNGSCGITTSTQRVGVDYHQAVYPICEADLTAELNRAGVKYSIQKTPNSQDVIVFVSREHDSNSDLVDDIENTEMQSALSDQYLVPFLSVEPAQLSANHRWMDQTIPPHPDTKFTIIIQTYKRTECLLQLLAHYGQLGPEAIDRILIAWYA